MLQVHHLNNSRSQRILWMLEELRLDYEIVKYQRDSQTMLAPDSLKQVHPLGKSPVVTDGDNTIAESGAIIDYLGRCYGDGLLRPTETEDGYQDYQYWLHFAEGSMMSPMLIKLVLQKVEENAAPFFVKFIAKQINNKVNQNFIHPNLTRLFAYVDTHLAVNEWFAGGKLTGADIQMSFPLEAAAHRGIVDKYPAILDYVAKIHARDAYKIALEKGGEYEFA